MSDESVKEVASTLKQDPSSFSILQNIILVSDLKKENEKLKRKNEEWRILYKVIEKENELLRCAYNELKRSYDKIEKENKDMKREISDHEKGLNSSSVRIMMRSLHFFQ